MQSKSATKYILLLPALLVLAATTIYPFFSALILSFRYWRMNKSPVPGKFVGFDNYLRAFSDPNFWNSMVVTLRFTLISVLLTILLALVMAIFLRQNNRVNYFFRTLLILPFAMAPVLKGYTWKFMLNDFYGIFDYIIDHLLPFAADINWLGDPFWAQFWLAMTEVWGWAPYIALVFIGALSVIPQETLDAAEIDGCNNWQKIRHVMIPQIMPVILIMTLLKTIYSLKMFDAVVSLTGGGPGRATETLNYFVYKTGFRFFDMGYASALAWILVFIFFIFAMLYERTLMRERR
jgi:multiple sugar transport system permease protein